MKKNKLVMLRGLPSSGKSTFALELVSKGFKRVNKDDLRSMIDNGKWSKSRESLIKEIERTIAIDFLTMGENVVVDNTNFGYEKYWEDIANNYKIDFEVKFFDTPFLECIERDAKRGEKSVGAKVIQRMYDQYLKPKLKGHNPTLEDCYIFDIDGCLALTDGKRSHYDFTNVSGDIPNRDIVKLVKKLYETTNNIYIVSGREDSCRKETEEWLEKNDIYYIDLYMRKTNDNREDSIIKREIYEAKFKDKLNILGVIDDRDRVVQMWRSLGITVFQCAYGNF